MGQPAGAYVLDPIGLLRVLTYDFTVTPIAVGGDSGGGTLKLGVTYQWQNKTQFVALLVADMDESWEKLNRLNAVTNSPFHGESARHANFWAVFQYLIDQHGAFLNGDWKFINTVLGLKSPAANKPCPYCIIDRDHLSLPTANARTDVHYAHKLHSTHETNTQLIKINTDHIVPLPLHVFLGLGDRLLKHIYPTLIADELLDDTISQIKQTQTHTSIGGGASDFYSFNGKELSKWIKGKYAERMIERISPSAPSAGEVIQKVRKGEQ